MTLGTILISLGLAVAPTPHDSLVSPDSAMALLRKGGYTIMLRHAQTDRSVSDIPGENTARYQQRNMKAVGVAQAKAVAAVFKAHRISVGDVFGCPLYPTMETALYAVRNTSAGVLLRTLDPSSQERALSLVPATPGANRVLVSHHFF